MTNVFIESLKRLYKDGKLKNDRIVELFESGKITKEEKNYILNAH